MKLGKFRLQTLRKPSSCSISDIVFFTFSSSILFLLSIFFSTLGLVFFSFHPVLLLFFFFQHVVLYVSLLSGLNFSSFYLFFDLWSCIFPLLFLPFMLIPRFFLFLPFSVFHFLLFLFIYLFWRPPLLFFCPCLYYELTGCFLVVRQSKYFFSIFLCLLFFVKRFSLLPSIFLQSYLSFFFPFFSWVFFSVSFSFIILLRLSFAVFFFSSVGFLLFIFYFLSFRRFFSVFFFSFFFFLAFLGVFFSLHFFLSLYSVFLSFFSVVFPVK